MAKKKRRKDRGPRGGESPIEKDAENTEQEPESTDIPPAPPSGDGDDPRDAAPHTVPAASTREADPPSTLPSRGSGKKPAAWGDPIAAFERRWTDFEAKLITVVLLGEVLVLASWVFLSGLSAPIASGNSAGVVFRAVVGGVALGLAARVTTKRMGMGESSTAAILAAIVLGFAIAPAWRSLGVDYFDNIKNWLQEGSTLTLMGGLRGLATRLTLWLALLGASLATAAGKHIHIDVVFRFLPTKFRVPAAIVNFLAASLVCLGAVWGFFDHIAIESYGKKADDSASVKIEAGIHEVGKHLFLTRKQIGLDLRSLPHVLKGDRYDTWMTAAQWNEWLRDGDFEPRFTADQVKTLVVPEDSGTHPPFTLSPDGEVTRGVLAEDLSLVFPFGFFVLALRFFLRAVLTLSGHIPVDPNAAHKEDFGQPKPEDEVDPDADAKADDETKAARAAVEGDA